MEWKENSNGELYTTINIPFRISKTLVDWVREHTGWPEEKIEEKLRCILWGRDPEDTTIAVYKETDGPHLDWLCRDDAEEESWRAEEEGCGTVVWPDSLSTNPY
jgi:hypothetical protein